MHPTLSDLERLITGLILPFHDLQRDMMLPLTPRRLENDAEHSWNVAFLACSLAPEIDKSLDVGKIAQYGLVHDLVEVFAGDTSPWHATHVRSSKTAREAQSLARIAKQYARFPWIARTIHEYEQRTTKEARFVWAVDKLLPLWMRYLDQGRSYKDMGITKKLFDTRLTEHRQKAHAHPEIGAYYDQLLGLFEKHPEYFYQEERK